MATIQIISGLNAGETFELTDRETLVGRHPDCTIVLRDSTVSRRHARFSKDSNGYFVDDVGSQHGTRLNGDPVRGPARLRDRDEIELSQTKIVFMDSDSVSSDDRPSTIITSLDVLSDSGSITEDPEAPRWRALLNITRTLGVSLDLRRILPRVLESIFLILPEASRGCIMLLDKETEQLEAFAVRDSRDRSHAPPLSRTVTSQVMSEGKAILSSDVGQDDRLKSAESVLELRMHSVVCAPLIGSSDQPFGLIHLDAQDPTKQFTKDDLDILVNIANLVGQAVDHSRLHETQLELHRQQRDLETARQVQNHFLPQDRPSIPGYQLYDYYHPADAVGGDYFGYTQMPDGQLAIAVGDVAGHGIPAALLMARLCAEARFCLVTNIIPCEAVTALNRELCKQTYSFFITFASTVLDPVRHELTVVNAGHMPPLVRRARTGKVESIASEVVSPPLGIDPEVIYNQATIKLEPGDVVLLYTDGVSESPNKIDDRFGIESIEDAVALATDAESAVHAVMGKVREFASGQSQEDDICVVAFSRNL